MQTIHESYLNEKGITFKGNKGIISEFLRLCTITRSGSFLIDYCKDATKKDIKRDGKCWSWVIDQE